MAKSTYKLNIGKLTKARKTFKFFGGNDIEAFLFDRKKNKIVSAIDVLKHGKDDPIALDSNTYAYYDNCLLEWKHLNPYSSKDEMIERIGLVLKKVQNHLGERYAMVYKAGHTFDDSEVQDKRALLIGCSSSYCAWSQSMKNNEPFKNNFRSSGGHQHLSDPVGNTFDDFDNRINAIKMLDIYVGTSNAIYSSDSALEKERRQIYGAAGDHRIPRYSMGKRELQGLEYRTLSSSFLNSREKTELTYDLVQYSLSHIVNKTYQDILKVINPSMVQTAIKDCNKELAEQILITAELPSELLIRVKANYDDNFEKSWGL